MAACFRNWNKLTSTLYGITGERLFSRGRNIFPSITPFPRAKYLYKFIQNHGIETEKRTLGEFLYIVSVRYLQVRVSYLSRTIVDWNQPYWIRNPPVICTPCPRRNCAWKLSNACDEQMMPMIQYLPHRSDVVRGRVGELLFFFQTNWTMVFSYLISYFVSQRLSVNTNCLTNVERCVCVCVTHICCTEPVFLDSKLRACSGNSGRRDRWIAWLIGRGCIVSGGPWIDVAHEALRASSMARYLGLNTAIYAVFLFLIVVFVNGE